MRSLRPGIVAEGIGDARMERSGISLLWRTRGWASLGPIDALKKIPRLLAIMWATAFKLVRDPPDLVVLVDFGAFNVRLASTLRRLGAKMPILYYFPPAAWLDNVKRAKRVAAVSDALTAFAHQRDFYRSLQLPVGYVGHPLVSTVAARAVREVAPRDGGVIALLPGSRQSEIERHTPRLLDALALVRLRRPRISATLVAIDDEAQRTFEHWLALRSPQPVTIVRDARAALTQADVAVIASGTAVLEAALLGTPAVSLYVLSDAQAKIARRVYRGKYITLPNLVLDEPVVPELFQEAATPDALAAALLDQLDAPARQLDGYARMRAALGPPDALARCAQFALDLAARV
ncbi:MAG: lipid-A-disaccharide synthase [Candidatus Velthaea sp.]